MAEVGVNNTSPSPEPVSNCNVEVWSKSKIALFQILVTENSVVSTFEMFEMFEMAKQKSMQFQVGMVAVVRKSFLCKRPFLPQFRFQFLK